MSDSSRSGGDGRIHARHGVDWRVTLNCPDWHFAGKLAAANASRGGLFLLTSRPPVIGSIVELVIQLPNGETINIQGTVQHVVTPEQADDQGRGPGVGIKFSEEHSETLRLLEQAADARTPQQAAPAAPGVGLPPPETAPAAPSKPAAPAPAAVRSSGATASAVGIDFGTTFTSIAIAMGDTVQLVADKRGRSLHPSVVHYPEQGRPICGWDARAMLAKSPRRTVSSIKRLLGRSFSDPKIAGLLQATSFKTLGGPNDSILVDIRGDHYAAGQVSAHIVGHVRDLAEAALGKRIEKAVLSIPVTFTELERQSVRRVAQLARVEVIGLIEEPVAAALAYGYGQSKSETVAVYDFGGGTFDFTVLAMDGNNFRVLASDGDTWLGGDDFDLAIAQAVADAFWRVTEVELRQRVVQWQKLLFACEHAKRELSVSQVTTILVENLVEAPKRMDLRQKLTRQIFEVLTKELFVRSLAVCKSALQRAGLRPENVDQVVVSGGVSRIPFIRQRLGEFFAREVTATVNPEAAICLGAGIRAAQLCNHPVRGAEMYG